MSGRGIIRCGTETVELEVAIDTVERLKGLLVRDSLEQGRGFLLPACSSVHTFFMRFPIDLVFIDSEMTVVKVRRNVPPFRLSSCRGAESTLELAAGEADRCGIEPGMRIERVEE